MKEAQVSETQVQALSIRPTEEIEETSNSYQKAPITAAQAKVEAVANLTMKVYEAASTLKLTPEEVSSLQAEFPDDAFKPGAAGKENLIYIEHAFLRDRLNQVFGPGQWAIIPRNRWAEPFTTAKGTEGSRVYVEAMLVIRGAFVAEAVGAMEYYPKNESQNYGDAVEGAKTAALRRCAKELGIGLQAWKKDWCDGWWKRKKGYGNAPGRSGGVSMPTQANKTAPTPTPVTPSQPARPAQPSPKTRPAQPAVFADSETRSRMINALDSCLDLAAEYFEKIGAILPNERLEDLPLKFVPVTKRQFEGLMECITAFGNGEEAMQAFLPNPDHIMTRTIRFLDTPPPEPAPPLPPPKPTKANVPFSNPVLPEKQPDPAPQSDKPGPEWFWEVIISVPRKGTRKTEYEKHPDTIRSLYDAMKDGDKEAQSRLWGLVNHWDAVPREVNGKTYQPSEADKKCREALDAFADFEENAP